MLLRRNKQVCFSFLCFLLVANAKHGFASLFESFGKMLLLLVLASLLAFLLVHSEEIYRHLAACLQSLGLALFEPAADTEPAKQPKTLLIATRKPGLPFRFQLPPPAFSL